MLTTGEAPVQLSRRQEARAGGRPKRPYAKSDRPRSRRRHQSQHNDPLRNKGLADVTDRARWDPRLRPTYDQATPISEIMDNAKDTVTNPDLSQE